MTLSDSVPARTLPVYDFSDVFLRKCASDGIQIDFLFIDHVKDLYLPDLQLCLELKILAPGCVVVADNVHPTSYSSKAIESICIPIAFVHASLNVVARVLPTASVPFASHCRICPLCVLQVLMPGAPEYKAWVLGSKLFDSRVVSTLLEYHKDVKDELLVSVFKG
jgi:hypothetical protein